jgi:uncharacterized protein YndB with AHSA1/START domain
MRMTLGLGLGRLERADDGRPRLTFARRFPQPPLRVWPALVEPAALATWFPTTVEGERRTGSALRFTFPQAEGPTMDGELTVFDPPTVLELRWGADLLRFELMPDRQTTHLTFSATFDDVGRGARDAAGWHTCLELLESHLSGELPAMPSAQRWAQVHPMYVQSFGPEAATVGPPTA